MEQKLETLTPETRRYRLKKHEPETGMRDIAEPQTPQSPSEWFSNKFPTQATIYGPPILEATYSELNDSNRTEPFALNDDFFAAILGGDEKLNHRVIYYAPEAQFYFFDPRRNLFFPTTDSKLVILLSQYLIQCASEMPADVDVKDLFLELRNEKNLRKVVTRTKALLAADETFFGEQSSNKRIKGPESHNRIAKTFVREYVRPMPDACLTVTDAFENFNQFCQERGMEPVGRRMFKSMIAEVIREEFNLGLRHDVLGPNRKQQTGWKGLATTDWRN